MGNPTMSISATTLRIPTGRISSGVCAFLSIAPATSHSEMKLTMRGHDDELFWDDVRRYGNWNWQHEKTGKLYAQIELPGE